MAGRAGTLMLSSRQHIPLRALGVSLVALLCLLLTGTWILAFDLKIATRSRFEAEAAANARITPLSRENAVNLTELPPQCQNLSSASAVFGVTITDIDKAELAVPALKALAENSTKTIVTRIVFDPIKTDDPRKFEERLRDYRTAVEKVSAVSCVMGEIADSYSLYFYFPDKVKTKWPVGYRNYEMWTERLVQTMGALVSVWEVGNEVNGEWVGWKEGEWKRKSAAERRARRERVGQLVLSAHAKVKSLQPDSLTAVTLFYNDDGTRRCTGDDSYRMNDWAKNHLPEQLRANIDYLFLSYYENTKDCPQVDGSAKGLAKVFVSLKPLFPSAITKFGFGEIGYKETCPGNKDSDRVNNTRCQAGQKLYIVRYYRQLNDDLKAELMKSEEKVNFIGGYFYWYFLQDVALSNNGQAREVVEAFQKLVRE